MWEKVAIKRKQISLIVTFMPGALYIIFAPLYSTALYNSHEVPMNTTQYNTEQSELKRTRNTLNLMNRNGSVCSREEWGAGSERQRWLGGPSSQWSIAGLDVHRHWQEMPQVFNGCLCCANATDVTLLHKHTSPLLPPPPYPSQQIFLLAAGAWIYMYWRHVQGLPPPWLDAIFYQ